MLHPNLGVRTVVAGLTTPSTMAFIGEDDILVLEKNTGLVQRVVDGVVMATVLDLAVNFGSERGLLGIALHPDFPGNPAYISTGPRARRAPTRTCSLTRRCSATGSIATPGTDRR